MVIEEETEAEVKVPPPSSEIAIATVFGTKPIGEAEDSGSEPIPLVLKTLQGLKQENEAVSARLDKQDDMFKEQAKNNNKIKEMLHAILSRL